MNNIDSTTSRSSFFPNRTNHQHVSENSKVDRTIMKRNDALKKEQIDSSSKNGIKIELSDAIKDFSRIKRVVDASPELDNTEKIDRIKSQIKNGTYKIDYDALADKLLSAEF